MREREYEFMTGYSKADPHANIAKDISPKRKEKVVENELDPAAERYRQWKQGVFTEHERTTRAASNSSARARQEQGEMEQTINEIKKSQNQWTDGVNAID